MMNRNEALISLWGLLVGIVVAIYCATLITLTDHRLKEYGALSVRNYDAILENQRLVGQHLIEFDRWMDEQDAHMNAQDATFTHILENQAKVLENQKEGLMLLRAMKP